MPFSLLARTLNPELGDRSLRDKCFNQSNLSILICGCTL